MESIFQESGRSARIATRFHTRIIHVALTKEALVFHTTLFGFRCKEIVAIPVHQIVSVKRVNERGIPSFEVNTAGRRKMCWFDSPSPDEWESAFSSVGIAVEHEAEKVAVTSDGD
jgi:hypothetical protein